MAREDAVEYLAAILAESLAIAGMTGEDSTGNLAEPLDRTDAAMAFADIPATDFAAQDAAYAVLAEYFVLLRIRYNVALRFNIGTRGSTYALNQSLAGVNLLIDEARLRALFLAGPAAVNGGAGVAAGADGTGIGAIDLDWSGGPAWTEEYAR